MSQKHNAATEDFYIKTTLFEGPLDVLLDLIEKRKLSINELSLAQVTDDYIAYVNARNKFNVAGTAHFILVASTLLLIKSRTLLPTLELTSEESADIYDLEERLKLLERIRALSRSIKERYGKNILFFREQSPEEEVGFYPHKSITTESLRNALLHVVAVMPVKELLPSTVVKKIVSLEEMIDKLLVRISKKLHMNFTEFAGKKTEKPVVIVSFLALLELVKQGGISVVQNENFGDIEIESKNVRTPQYT